MSLKGDCEWRIVGVNNVILNFLDPNQLLINEQQSYLSAQWCIPCLWHTQLISQEKSVFSNTAVISRNNRLWNTVRRMSIVHWFVSKTRFSETKRGWRVGLENVTNTKSARPTLGKHCSTHMFYPSLTPTNTTEQFNLNFTYDLQASATKIQNQ